jgi:iron complex outermembrane receptor protein
LKSIFVLIFVVSWTFAFPQVKQSDSTKILKEVNIIYSFFSPDFSRSTGAETYISDEQLKNQQQSSLVGILNTVSGVRMEERSPGSYRLSLRGSLLRSPFGIRNVKIYIDEFPLTDAGGNTYLNLIDAGLIGSLTIFKGPQASIFGANTGGAVLISSARKMDNYKEITLSSGSYEAFHQTAKVEQAYKNFAFNISEGYQKSNGYRENSALERKYLQASTRWNYNTKGMLKVFALYSDLEYQTPGGLTAVQMLANPRSARPATPTLLSATEQQAGIYNETFFGGLANSFQFNPNLQFVVALFGNHTNFENPFITNYEKRKENTLGLRSFINYRWSSSKNEYNLYLGVEGSRTSTDIKNYGNDKGTASALIASDDLNARQDFAFFKLNIDLNKSLILELGASLNFFGYNYESYFPLLVAQQNRNFKAQLMPKFGASYRLNETFTMRSSISKGYSPPTVAEVRASDNVINTNLQAEGGFNYETGLNYHTQNNRFNIDGSLFYFHLKNAIVRRLTSTDAEYFLNAGGTKQLGTELQASFVIIQPSNEKFLNGLKFNSSFTYSHFKFEDFKNGVQDFSGNRLTGVPNHTVVNSLEFTFLKGFFLICTAQLYFNYSAK